MQTDFEGIWVPIITPMTGDETDLDAQARLACWLEQQGVAGLVVGATTGEGALLSPQEQEDAFISLRAAVPGLPLVAGVSQASTRAAVAQAQHMAMLQPAALLVTPPPYVRPSQAGVQRHFEAIVEATGLPLMVYNIPYRTGVNVELATLQALCHDPRVVAIKECGGSNERLLRLVHETPLKVLCGDDAQNLAAFCLGAHGAISASAHVRPDLHIGLWRAVRAGQLPLARRLALALQPAIDALFAEPNPAPVKAWLAGEGWCTPQVRLPFLPASPTLDARLALVRTALAAVAEVAETGLPA